MVEEHFKSKILFFFLISPPNPFNFINLLKIIYYEKNIVETNVKVS
jgi:hypothetical protein